MGKSEIITLCLSVKVDIFNVPDNFDEIIIETFKKYTNGTHHDYTYVDKLGFIDRCIERINGCTNSYDRVEEWLQDVIDTEWKENHELADREVVYGFDTMVALYDQAAREHSLHQHYGSDDHHVYDEIQLLMCRIIKTVMNFEWPEEQR